MKLSLCFASILDKVGFTIVDRILNHLADVDTVVIAKTERGRQPLLDEFMEVASTWLEIKWKEVRCVVDEIYTKREEFILCNKAPLNHSRHVNANSWLE